MEILIVLENDHAFIEWVFTADVCKRKKKKNQRRNKQKTRIILVIKKIIFFGVWGWLPRNFSINPDSTVKVFPKSNLKLI